LSAPGNSGAYGRQSQWNLARSEWLLVGAVPQRLEIKANGVRFTLVSRPGPKSPLYHIDTGRITPAGGRRYRFGRRAAAIHKEFQCLVMHLNQMPPGPTNRVGTGRRAMQTKRYWLDYDPVALAVLVIGIGAIELLALSI
jgi:hypothetical protein